MNTFVKAIITATVLVCVGAFVNTYAQTVLNGGMFYTAPFNASVVSIALITALVCAVYAIINLWKKR